MSHFIIEGGKPLHGFLNPQGAKNEALQILSAVLLCDEMIEISNIPQIIDVLHLIDILKLLGVKVEKKSEDTYTFHADQIDVEILKTPQYLEKASKLRGSVMLLGPLLARCGLAYLPKPGGDKIGRRPIDTHLVGFQKLGATFSYDEEKSIFSIQGTNLKGATMLLEEPSVTGTANLLLCSVLIPGDTTIYNAACEPYIQQLCKMLNQMGAKISGIGSNLLKIQGVEKLHATTHRMLPDMIEIGSFIGLAAMTQSEITIKNCAVDHLGLIPDTFQKLGIQLEIRDDDIFIPSQDIYEISTYIDGSILTIYDHPWPGFTPDLLSILLVTAIQAKGAVLVHQKMFESRLFFVDKLKDMGAQIILCDPHRAMVLGLARQKKLRGIQMTSPDIRAGVSLLIAALSAEGTSIIHSIDQIDRGYQNIDIRLNQIGAQIYRK
ncbi:MAG: UDP-N-acetylglucosamine 1-carboxyvinyltransferase [Chitinophagales bacterium]|jgi:UDP-N-acetylglucosamine 1-carboxyvinyltransferase|nr:UDP-N-acetylglucosamine 1-carboxyvinyltransferase [Chitinophagales bacterium]